MGFLGGTTDYRSKVDQSRQVDYGGWLDQNLFANDATNINASRADQSDFISALRRQYEGNGPSLAQAQYDKAINQAQQGQAGAISSQKGINTALASRLIGQQGTAYGQGAASETALIKQREQMAAGDQLANALAQRRQQDLGASNLDTQKLATVGQLFQGQNQLGLQGQLGEQGINANIENANAAAHRQYIGAGIKAWGDSSAQFMGSMGSMTAMSDENQKTDVSSGDGEVKSFLDAISANKYKYKKSADIDNKEHVSPMAQELEQSGMGSEMVLDGDKGKMIDYGKSGPAILASLAYLNKKIDSMGGDGMYQGGDVEDMTDGGEVPGEAEVGGDSEKNDVVHAMLSPDEIVLPRTVAMDDSGEAAKLFVQEIAKHGKKKTSSGYASVISAKKAYGGRV